jgi:transcriptional regulator with XRE-family HTH domain
MMDGMREGPTFAQVLFEARTRKGQTQTEAAAEIGTSQANACAWERGRKVLYTWDLLESLERYLGVAIPELALLILRHDAQANSRRRGAR